jgi:hypothetical protein
MRIYADGNPEDPNRCRVQVHPANVPWHQCLIAHKRNCPMCSDHETRAIMGYPIDVPAELQPATGGKDE